MADEQTTRPELDSSTILVEIEPEHLSAVLELVDSLTQAEAEVSGYSFTQPIIGGAGGPDQLFGRKSGTLTGAVITDNGTIYYADKDK